MLPDQTEFSDLFPQLHPVCLDQLKSNLKFFKRGWFHGDGNFYPAERDSNDRVDFHNDTPANFGAGYRKFYKDTDTLPTSLAELEKELVAANNAEKNAAAQKEQRKNISNSLAVPREDDALKPKNTKAVVNNGIVPPITAKPDEKKDAPPPPPPPPPVKDEKKDK